MDLVVVVMDIPAVMLPTMKDVVQPQMKVDSFVRLFVLTINVQVLAHRFVFLVNLAIK